MLIRSLHDSAHRIFELASQSRRGNRVGYAMLYVYQPFYKGSIMAMRTAKASTANITAEIQAEGEFDLTLVLVMENAANGGVSMKFESASNHKWYNNRLGSDAAMDNLDSVAHALGLATWDDSDPVKSFKEAVGKTCRIQIISKRSGGVTYYNVAKFSKIEKVEAKKGNTRTAKASDKPFDDGDIPF